MTHITIAVLALLLSGCSIPLGSPHPCSISLSSDRCRRTDEGKAHWAEFNRRRAAFIPSAHDSTIRQSLADDLYKLETVAKRFYTAVGVFTPNLHLMRPYMEDTQWELFGENPDLFIGLNVLNYRAQEVVISGKVLGEKSECNIRVRPPGYQKHYVECEWLR